MSVVDTALLGKELTRLGSGTDLCCSVDFGIEDGHRIYGDHLTECIFSGNTAMLCFDGASESIPKEQTDAHQLLRDVAHMIRSEFLDCKNNDCRCRQGFGLCNQCKEAAIDLCNRIDDVTQGGWCG